MRETFFEKQTKNIMDYKDKEVIISRFNDAIKYIATMQKAIFNENRSSEIEQKRNAGEALSCAYEWSVKHHLFKYAVGVAQDWKDCDFFRESPMIKWGDLLSALRDRNKAKPFLSILPNFNKLYDDKKDGRNISTHSGKEPIEENIYSFSEEVRKLILAYVDKDATLNHIEEHLEFNSTNWENFYSACNKFERTDTNYILIIGDLKSQPTPFKKYLSSLPWNLIIDFDQSSRHDNGFYNICYSSNSTQPTTIKIADKLDTDFFPISPKAHFHYFIKGFIGDGSSINPLIKFNDWNRSYGENLKITISSFAHKYPSVTKVIVFHDDIPFVAGLGGVLDKIFADRTEFIICSPNIRLNERFEEDGYDVNHIPLSISELANGVSLRYQEFEAEDFFENSFRLPHNKNSKTANVDGLFSIDDIKSFEEDMEILYLGIEKNTIQEDRLDFLRGKMPLSWYGANLKDPFDVRHPKQKAVLKDIQEKDKKGIYFIKHEPGVGGTTFVRRLAWELHEDNPTIILKDYRDGERIVKKLETIFNKTRERIFVIANVPQSVSVDDLKDLDTRLKSKAWPSLIIAVGRDFSKMNSTLNDWGTNCGELINEFKKYLPELDYSADVILKKEKELDNVQNGSDNYKKTPFYVGFLVSEENFFGIEPFIKNFITSLKTPEQRKIISYIALVQDYLGIPLPSIFFSKLLRVNNEFSVGKLTELLPQGFENHVLTFTKQDNLTSWSTRHPLFAKKFKEQLLRGNSINDYAWKENLPDLCKDFIEDSNLSGEQPQSIEDILQSLFIGSRQERGGETFTKLVNEMIPESQESVFLKLAEVFPDNPHYFSHLARFYAYIRKNSEKALKFANGAIHLSEKEGRKDALLYHIRGMCYRQAAKTKIDSIINAKKNGRPYFPEEVDEIIIELIPKAAIEFRETRKLQRSSEYGYVAHIQMLIDAIDFGHILSDKTKEQFLSSEKEPYAEWLDEASTLLEEVKRITIGEEGAENEKVIQCDDSLNSFFERYDLVIQNLNNQLDKGKNQERIRRQISRFMIKKQPNLGQDSKSVNRIMELMSENIKNEPDKEGNFYLWFQAARYSNLHISDAIEKMSRWKAKSTTLDASYYFYVLKVMRAMEGYSDEMVEAVKLIQDSKQKSKSLPNNTYCHEWYGQFSEMKRMVHGKDVYGGNWEDKCELVNGIITSYLHDGSGKITLRNANLLEVFFNPSETKMSEDDINKEVEFYLGFSYDGLRAKDVQLKGIHQKRNNFGRVMNSTNSLESLVGKINLPKPDSQPITKIESVQFKTENTIKGSKNEEMKFSIESENIFVGIIKVKNFDYGEIKCEQMDRKIVFYRNQLVGCDMKDLSINMKVYFKIKPLVDSKSFNYKASEVRILQ